MSEVYSQNPQLFTITNANGMQVTVMDWGATIISIKVPTSAGQLREMVIGPKNAEDWARQYCYMGATVGRYANRIDGCTFDVKGKSYTVETNNEPVALHGGRIGFDKKRFEVLKQTKNSITFFHHSPDGDMGFPGNFDLTVKYSLADNGALNIQYNADCDKECPACITNHSYFNLNGFQSSVLKHEAKLNSEEFLVVNDKCIPTGEVYKATAHKKADGSKDNFDFTEFKPFAPSGTKADFADDKNMTTTRGYDHAFIIRNFGDTTQPCMTVRGEKIDNAQVQLDVYTSYPAFQFYAGCFLNVGTPDVALARDTGKAYEPYEGFAIEPEYFPDAPHLPEFARVNPMVSPEAPLQKFITYKFTVL